MRIKLILILIILISLVAYTMQAEEVTEGELTTEDCVDCVDWTNPSYYNGTPINWKAIMEAKG